MRTRRRSSSSRTGGREWAREWRTGGGPTVQLGKGGAGVDWIRHGGGREGWIWTGLDGRGWMWMWMWWMWWMWMLMMVVESLDVGSGLWAVGRSVGSEFARLPSLVEPCLPCLSCLPFSPGPCLPCLALPCPAFALPCAFLVPCALCLPSQTNFGCSLPRSTEEVLGTIQVGSG